MLLLYVEDGGGARRRPFGGRPDSKRILHYVAGIFIIIFEEKKIISWGGFVWAHFFFHFVFLHLSLLYFVDESIIH